MARRPRPRGWYEKSGDPPGTERFWDGEKWGPNPRYKRGQEPQPTRRDDAEERPGKRPPATVSGVDQGSVWARISARSIDMLVLFLPLLLLYSRGFATVVDDSGEPVPSANMLYLGVAVALAVFYEAGFTAWWGATPGKRAVGLKVIDRESGQSPPPRAKAAMRATPMLMVISPPVTALLWLGCVAAMYMDRRLQRSLFDFSGATLVVLDPARAGRLAQSKKK